MTDPIADFLTRIRNAQMAGNTEVVVPHSNVKEGIADVLVKNKFLTNHEVSTEGKFKVLILTLPEKQISLKRVSKPGQRIYSSSEEIRKVDNGFGIVVVSTSKGIMTGYEARKHNIGGELLCEVS